MKSCPQCNSVFENGVAYCPKDGAVLIDENFSLPSADHDFEDDTVIRREPIVVNLSGKTHAPPETPQHQPIVPPVENVIVRVPQKNNAGKYVVFLLIGLLLGGGLVLATLLLTRNSDNTNNNSRVNSPLPQNVNVNAGIPTETTATSIHQGHTADADDEFNGRVISLNAYVRASPSRTASELDILPIDDRLTITDRNDPNGLWFHVVCEHGTSGWMHGNTIEYTR